MTRFADAVDVRWPAGALSLCAFDRDPVAAGVPTARLLHHPWELVPPVHAWGPFMAWLAERRGEDRSGRRLAGTALGSLFLLSLLSRERDAQREADRRARRPSAQDGERR